MYNVDLLINEEVSKSSCKGKIKFRHLFMALLLAIVGWFSLYSVMILLSTCNPLFCSEFICNLCLIVSLLIAIIYAKYNSKYDAVMNKVKYLI